jgi:hypothetical protein
MLQRAGAMATAAALKFFYVTIAFEAEATIVANQLLNQKTKDAIGSTMYGIICEEGWKDLWRRPFGYGIYFGPRGEKLISY